MTSNGSGPLGWKFSKAQVIKSFALSSLVGFSVPSEVSLVNSFWQRNTATCGYINFNYHSVTSANRHLCTMDYSIQQTARPGSHLPNNSLILKIKTAE